MNNKITRFGKNYLLSLPLLLLMLLSSAQISSATNFSVSVNNEFTYSVETSDGNGEFTVKVTEISQMEEDYIHGGLLDHYVTGLIKGEYSDQPHTEIIRYGWHAVLYLEAHFNVSVMPSGSGLYHQIYENSLQLFWPTNDEFYIEMENINYLWGVSIATEKVGEDWIITEYIDQTPVDGCLCQTEITVRDGIAIQISQNETSYFAYEGEMTRYAFIQLQDSNTNRLELDSDLTAAGIGLLILGISTRINSRRRNVN